MDKEDEETKMKIKQIEKRESQLDKIFYMLIAAKTLQSIKQCEKLYREIYNE